MRTTLNLDDDLAARLAEEARRRGTSLSRAVNDTLRAGLRWQAAPPEVAPYVAPALDTGRPRLDVADVAEALDTLGDA
jgi:hypothetical protein